MVKKTDQYRHHALVCLRLRQSSDGGKRSPQKLQCQISQHRVVAMPSQLYVSNNRRTSKHGGIDREKDGEVGTEEDVRVECGKGT